LSAFVFAFPTVLITMKVRELCSFCSRFGGCFLNFTLVFQVLPVDRNELPDAFPPVVVPSIPLIFPSFVHGFLVPGPLYLFTVLHKLGCWGPLWRRYPGLRNFPFVPPLLVGALCTSVSPPGLSPSRRRVWQFFARLTRLFRKGAPSLSPPFLGRPLLFSFSHRPDFPRPAQARSGVSVSRVAVPRDAPSSFGYPVS